MLVLLDVLGAVITALEIVQVLAPKDALMTVMLLAMLLVLLIVILLALPLVPTIALAVVDLAQAVALETVIQAVILAVMAVILLVLADALAPVILLALHLVPTIALVAAKQLVLAVAAVPAIRLAGSHAKLHVIIIVLLFVLYLLYMENQMKMR